MFVPFLSGQVHQIKVACIGNSITDGGHSSTAYLYQLAVNSSVLLKVYDVMGREIATLVDERQSAGTHSIRFDATKLTSGVYFYKLRAGEYSAARKFVLMK